MAPRSRPSISRREYRPERSKVMALKALARLPSSSLVMTSARTDRSPPATAMAALVTARMGRATRRDRTNTPRPSKAAMASPTSTLTRASCPAEAKASAWDISAKSAIW